MAPTNVLRPDAPLSQPDRRMLQPAARPISAWHLVTGAVVGAVLAITASGGGDPDLYWHRVLGGFWLDQRSIRIGATDPIAYTPGQHWLPTAWLTEVLYDRLVSVGGYAGIVALRLLVTAAILALLVRFTHRHLPVPRASLVLAVICIPIAFDFQDRPQTLSFLLVALLLPTLHRWLDRAALPSVLGVAWFTWIWANVHGLWVLVPVLLLVAGLSSWPDRSAVKAAALRLGVALAAGALTPVGPELLLIPWRVRSSTAQITEWEPTSLDVSFTWAFAATLLVVLIAWASRSAAVPIRQVAYVAAVSAFGMLAFRNVTVSTLLLVPVLVTTVAGIAPRVISTVTLPRRVVLPLSALVVLLGTSTYLREPIVPEHFPAEIATRLAASPTPIRVMNDYNISGFLREFGGENARLAIDGRADRYGAKTILTYGDMTSGFRGWKQRFDRYDPDVVVINKDSPLRELLVDRGWTVELVDSGIVLLTRAQS